MCFLCPVLMWRVFFDINEKHATKKRGLLQSFKERLIAARNSLCVCNEK